ncbi:hypothetical protein [Mucilaginibacter xinganensis]|uniref:Uncharacterized protein n=1 Tax=Mucilaginibacter xinganensis TaxID=1234841 RepID=A0A223P1B9_9SPHI|nr:hypothetical protein [Mucilaginibacter xinganensis]ASU35915.1 hypothetical protein MuYL_4030 [Mucilaginibacter xinganensis]
MKPENIELQNKIIEGANKAYVKLLISSAEKKQSLVIADKDGYIQHVPARELLKKLSEK